MQKVFLHGGAILVAHRERWKVSLITRKLFVMVKLFVFVALGCLQARASGWGQSISIHVNNASLEHVFTLIEGQSSYRFVYTKEELSAAGKVSLSVKDRDIVYVLDQCFKNQPLQYRLKEQYVIVSAKEQKQVGVEKEKSFRLTGLITDEEGLPLEGVTVSVKGLDKATATDRAGRFVLELKDGSVTIVVTSVGYASREIDVAGKSELHIVMQRVVNSLDETVVIAYGKTTRRLNTGNIGKVTAADIEKQPVSNVLAALQGRVPGLVITQQSGIPGAGFKVQIQGQQSIANRGSASTRLVTNDPLIVIDGVPFAAGNQVLNQLISAAGNPDNGFGLSPLNLINPSDIESVEILKDADATAIYGSRGANGVILITTKKANKGDLKFNLSVQTGVGKATRTMKMLDIHEYLQMRHEAIRNDGGTLNNVPATNGYAPELIYWDTTTSTNWTDYFIGGTSGNYDLNFTISGGNNQNGFIVGVGQHRETSVLPGELADLKSSLKLRLSHTSRDQKIRIDISTFYSVDQNKLPSTDLTSFIWLMPHFPGFFESDNTLKWGHNGIGYNSMGINNPMAYLKQRYNSNSKNFFTNLNFETNIGKYKKVRVSAGYNNVSIDEKRITPIASLNPVLGATGRSLYGNRTLTSWIVEPQMEYARRILKNRFQVLLGTTFQSSISENLTIDASGYVNDDLLYNLSAAPQIRAESRSSDYKYNAVFGRIQYDYSGKHVFNLSGRLDGSSRFGKGNQFATFGAFGYAWIFSEEKWASKLPFLSFGKLKASYGITGNDQIGDYKFMSTWTVSPNSYQQSVALIPSRLANPNFGWETNNKFNLGLETSWLENKFSLNVSFYRNVSENQLVSYPLPAQTGFSTLAAKNIPAKVENKGLELESIFNVVETKTIHWRLLANITFPKNTLLAYPGIELSTYANTYVIGKSLNLINTLKYTGVNSTTGLYQFSDLDSNGTFNTRDFMVLGDLDPNMYGGLTSSLKLGKFSIDILAEFRDQTGINFLSEQIFPPGRHYNQPIEIRDRWRQSGDMAQYQRLTNLLTSQAADAQGRLNLSSGIYSNASFIRLKNVSISYDVNGKIASHPYTATIYLRGQNIMTFSNYRGLDPESQSSFRLPPLSIITFGTSINF